MNAQYALKIRRKSLAVILFIVLLLLLGMVWAGVTFAQQDMSLVGTTWEETRDIRWTITFEETGNCRIQTPRGTRFGRWEKIGDEVEFHSVTPEGRAKFRCTLNGDVCNGTATGQEFRGILSLRRKK